MKTKTINLYTFEELTKKQQEKLYIKHVEINIYDDWHADILEQCTQEFEFLNCEPQELAQFKKYISHVELDKIEFRLDHNIIKLPGLEFNLIDFIKDNAEKYPIFAKLLQGNDLHYSAYCKHGNICGLFVESDLHCMLDPYDPEFETRAEVEQEKIENDLLYLAKEFGNAILYTLNKHYDSLISDEAIKETLICNDYYFNGETLEIEYN